MTDEETLTIGVEGQRPDLWSLSRLTKKREDGHRLSSRLGRQKEKVYVGLRRLKSGGGGEGWGWSKVDGSNERTCPRHQVQGPEGRRWDWGDSDKECAVGLPWTI